MNELIKIDPKEFGIQESKAKEIASQFKPMLKKMEELEEEFNKVMQMPIDDEKTAEEAKKVRLKYVKVRTGTADIHKEQKAFYLAGGRFVDGWKNAQVFASQGKEEKLKAIEEHKKRLEEERLENLQNERVEALSKYLEDASERDLSSMDDDVWEAYLATKKQAYEDKIEAEKKAEAERLENEMKEKLYRERLNQVRMFGEHFDFDKLNTEISEKEFNQLFEDAKKSKEKAEIEAEKTRKENERLRKEAESAKAKEEKERKAREAKEKAEREAYEAKLKKEREEREKIQKELQAKAEEEAKAKAEAEAKKEAELKKGDAEKFQDFVLELENLKTKYSFKSKTFEKKYSDASKLIDKILNHIK